MSMSIREVDVSQQQPGIEATFGAWWPRTCESGAEFLRRTVPRWGNARYLWDLVEPDETDPGRLGWRGVLVSVAVVLGAASVAGLLLRTIWLGIAALARLF